MDEFISLSPIPGSNGFEQRMPMPIPCHSPNSVPGEFTERSGSYLSTLMDSGGESIVSESLELRNLVESGRSEVEATAGTSAGIALNIEEQPPQINWDGYMRRCKSKMAPMFFFKHNTLDVPGLNPGMKLEAIDKNNPPSFCVATVVQVIGHRLRVRYDGYGGNSSNDFWCNFQAEELHPIGWCAQNGFPLQPPDGINCTLEEWRTFLTQTLTGALAAPRELFRKDHLQPRVHGFKAGMKLEVIHPSKPSIICPATVMKSLGPYYFMVSTDYIQELPTVTFCCHCDSIGIFPPGWSYKNGIDLAVPSNYSKKSFSWEKYISLCHGVYAPQHLFKKPKAHKFKAGLKLEAVDVEQSGIIRVATLANVMGNVLQLFFDGQSRFQFVESDSPDIYPIGWCKRTGHPLHTQYGRMPSKHFLKYEGQEFYDDKLKLISFADVINRKNAASKNVATVQPSPLAVLQRKPTPVLGSATKPEEIKDDKIEKLSQPLSPSDDEDDISDEEGNGTGSERFYHNKNRIFFNKSCCCGPLLNPEQVKLLQDATEPGKVATVIRTGLEKVAWCAKDPEKVMDMMQEGSGVRVILKHKGKVLKKAISRVDSRPKLERYLKRFCRRLVCCEYFLSLTPVASPCPDKCQADEHGNLQGPKGLKAKRSREYFETKHLGYEKKKRGRKSKSELAASEAAARRAAAGIVTTVFHKGDRVPLPNLDLPVTAIADHLRNAATKILNQNSMHPTENILLPKPALPSAPAAILTHSTTQANSSSNVVATTATAVPNFGKPRILPSPQIARDSVRSVNPTEIQANLVNNPSVLGRPVAVPVSNVAVATLTREQLIQRPISPATQPHPGATMTTYTMNTVTKQPLLPQTTMNDKGNVMANQPTTKRVFRLAPPKFTAPHISRSPHPPIQSKFSPRLLAVRQPLPPGVNYRLALPPKARIISNQANIATSLQAAVTAANTLVQTRPPPLIPARTLSGLPSNVNVMNISQKIPIMKAKLQEVLEKKVVTAAPNVCVTERGTFVTAQVNKVAAPAITGNPIIGQSPDANAMMKKMFSVVKYSENGVVLTQVPTANVASGNVMHPAHVNQPSVQDVAVKPSRPSVSQSGPAVHKVSIGGGMGAVTSAVCSGLLTKEDRGLGHGSTNGISEKSITQGGGFSITINDNNLEDTTKAVENAPSRSSEENGGNNEGKSEVPVETLSKRALWLHRRRKKKKARFTYVKGKARKKKEGELYAPMSQEDAMGKQQQNGENGEEFTSVEMAAVEGIEGASPKRGRPNKLEENDGRRRGRPPKRTYCGAEEEMEDEKDPSFTPQRPVQISPKRYQRTAASYAHSEMERKYSSPPTASPDHAHPGSPPRRGASGDVTNTETTADTPTGMTSPKAQLMKGVLHAVQSSQHPSVKLRSPTGKQSNSVNGFSSPPSKRPRLLTSCSPMSKKSRGFHSSGPKSLNTSLSRSPYKRTPRYASIGTNTSLPGCSSDMCIYHPSNPKLWTIEQVGEYVQATDCKNYATLFTDQEIDGEALLLLTRNALMQFTNMKLGPTLKMSNYIAQLGARAGSVNVT